MNNLNNLGEFAKIIYNDMIKEIRFIPAHLINSAKYDMLNNDEIEYFLSLDNPYVNFGLIYNYNIDIKIRQKIIDNTIKKDIFK